jgi:dihydrofolate synthase/folylpolyglutamate synthase
VEALAEAARFQVRPEAVEEGLRTVYLPGRFEIIHRSPLVILDGAHNAMAARALSGELRRHRFRRLHIVVGMIEGHSPDGLLRELAPLASAVYATKPTWIRGQPADVIAERARPFCPDVHAIEPPLAAARLALEAADAQDTVLITGSFYVLGDVPPARLLENS